MSSNNVKYNNNYNVNHNNCYLCEIYYMYIKIIK